MHKGDKHHLQLFDAIDKMKDHREDELLKKLRHTSFAATLSMQKNRLTDYILKCLRNYHENSSVRLRLANLNEEIHILFKKGLYELGSEKIKKAKSLAENYEEFPALMELYEMENNILRRKSFQPLQMDEIKDRHRKVNTILGKYQNLITYSYFKYEFEKYIESGLQSRSRSTIEKIKTLIKNPLLGNGDKALSLKAKEQYYFILGSYYRSIFEYEKAVEMDEVYVQLIESNQHHIGEYTGIYMGVLMNLSIAYIEVGKYKQALDNLNKLNKLAKEDLRFRKLKTLSSLMRRAYAVELFAYVQSGKISEGKTLIRRIEKEVGPKEVGNKNVEITILYYTACLFVLTGEYNKALPAINKVIAFDDSVRRDLHAFARVLNMLVHFELENLELLESVVKSTYRYLIKRDHLFEFEKRMIIFIRKKLMKVANRSELLNAFSEFKMELEELLKDPYERGVLLYFDIISWLESRIENRPFVDIVREKVKDHL